MLYVIIMYVYELCMYYVVLQPQWNEMVSKWIIEL